MDNDQFEALSRQLNLLIGTIQLAHSEAIKSTRDELYADPVAAAILESAEDWVQAGTLRAIAMKAGNVSDSTAKRKVAELLARRLIEQAGAGPTIKYRRTGLV